MENKFSPRKVNSYSLDELFEFCETGPITLEELENAGLNEPSLSILAKRINKFRETKELDDWNSVKDSSIIDVEKYISKYHSSQGRFYNQAHDRIDFFYKLSEIQREIDIILWHTDDCQLWKFLEDFQKIETKFRNLLSQSSGREREDIKEKLIKLEIIIRLLKYLLEEIHTLRPSMDAPRYSSDGGIRMSIPEDSFMPRRLSNSFNWNIFKKKKTVCNSAVFAPAEIAKGDDLFVQVYIYKDEDTDKVIIDSRMSDKDTTQRSYTPLNFPIKKGNKITIRIDMHGLSVEGDATKSVIWQNKFTKCSFFVYVPINYDKTRVTGDVYLSVNGMELGQMSFFSSIGRHTDSFHSAQVEAKIYEKVFISYSHKDDATVKSIAEAYKALGTIDYFYDRHTLSPGDFFEKEIYEYIDQCDLFVLCWSKNAEDSEWVKKERARAFIRAIDSPPRLKLYPINIRPYAAPPSDMAGKIHFEDYDKVIDLPENQEELKE